MANLNVIGGVIASQPLNENFQRINNEMVAHEADTTNVHGIADTAVLETVSGSQAKVDTHSAATTSVHGIVDTSKLALGTLGYTQVTTTQSGITTEVDLTGLSATVTVGTGRRIKITAQASLYSTVDNDTGAVKIVEGATTLNVGEYPKLSITNTDVKQFSAVVTPTSGVHTYKLTCVRTSGTGGVISYATVERPAFILVEDIGAA